MRGVQFIFRTPEGTSWIMFASEPMNLVFDKVRKTTISSSAPYTGVIRLAYIPGDEKTFDSSTGLRRLIYHSAIYPVGGQVSFAASSSSSSTSTTTKTDNGDSSRHATVTFSYATRSMVSSSLQSSSNNNLLMLALPHHAELLSKTVKLSQMKFDLEYKCIKGKMTPVIGSTWSYDEPLFDLAFDSGFNPVDNATQQLILQQVNDDLDRVLPTFAENVYGYGKQVARLAQLAHIADRLEPKSLANENTTESNSVLGKATKVLSYYLESYLSSKVSDGLLFDSKMGGLVSNNGLHDKGEDFGNGRYNGEFSIVWS
jgi:endoglucanase Acf2